MLGGSIGAALAAKVLVRLDEFNAAQLGSLARLLATVRRRDLLLRQILATASCAYLFTASFFSP